MHDPPHPGGIARRQCLEPLGLTVTRAAEGLGVTQQALSELLNRNTGVSVEMAIRLSKAFGSTPKVWLGVQMAYDLWQVRARAGEIAVEHFEVAWRGPRRHRTGTGGYRGPNLPEKKKSKARP